jgi:hypothetical protein
MKQSDIQDLQKRLAGCQEVRDFTRSEFTAVMNKLNTLRNSELSKRRIITRSSQRPAYRAIWLRWTTNASGVSRN